MNWTIITVIAAVLLLVPVALLATFSTTRDTYRYEEHYGAHGYSQEVQGESTAELDAQPEAFGDEPLVEPLSEWPQDL